MEITDATMIEVVEQSQVSDARRRVVSVGRTSGLDEKAQDRASLVCTELATNLLKHTGKGGYLVVQGLVEGDVRSGIELYSIDSGAGMDVSSSVVDGVSTSGTFGTGLGAIKRMSNELEMFSLHGAGTVIQTRIWNSIVKGSNPLAQIGGFTVPKAGEVLSGDKWTVIESGSIIYCLLVDGLGHGIEAAEASKLAKRRFEENLSMTPAVMIKMLHQSLRGTRGAVGAVARIDAAENKIDYCGLGNITGSVYNVVDQASKHLVSTNGTLGYESPKIVSFSQSWNPDCALVMHSDGLHGRISDSIGSVAKESAQIIAGWLYKQHAKNNDDSTIMVVKQLRAA